MIIDDLLDRKLLEEMIEWGFVRQQNHPEFPLRILNYTAQTQYENVWNDVTRQCRGIIYNTLTDEIVARPFPKFHNYGEHVNPPEYYVPRPQLTTLSMDTPVEVTDKLDGSLGILYRFRSDPKVHPNYIATRGSFTSDQALWGSEQLRRRVTKLEDIGEVTYLFELIYGENRIVVDYPFEDIVLLGGILIETGTVIAAADIRWNGRKAEQFQAPTLADALLLEPRPNCEGVVVRFLEDDLMIKIKQEDYVALHRIMTGLNARNIWEIEAVKACHEKIAESKHWGSFLGIGPERAEECLAVADDWLEGVPDEFYAWVKETKEEIWKGFSRMYAEASEIAEDVIAAQLEPRDQYQAVSRNVLCRELTRCIRDPDSRQAWDALYLRCWREQTPEPTAPFYRSEDVA